ncbi:MAG: hypothetical protein DRP42_03780, partial [Tenericutes bacterium]
MNKTIQTAGLILKHEEMKTEFSHLNSKLQAIILFINYKCIEVLNIQPVWTSFYRKKRRDSGVHE